jgi:hypothetical protein
MNPGVNLHTPPGRCMVVGCDGKAIYRSPYTFGSASKQSGRGYCRKHKDFAISGAGTPSYHKRLNHLVQRLGHDDQGQR